NCIVAQYFSHYLTIHKYMVDYSVLLGAEGAYAYIFWEDNPKTGSKHPMEDTSMPKTVIISTSTSSPLTIPNTTLVNSSAIRGTGAPRLPPPTNSWPSTALWDGAAGFDSTSSGPTCSAPAAWTSSYPCLKRKTHNHR
ncbi:MAG: hypothetical protein J5954_02400, partial [Prevotella sp.]|nr:hypothetical protein [Prevotella sp.]